jgi:beta-galactosidase GanA
MGPFGDNWLKNADPVPAREIPDGGAVIVQLAANEFLVTGHRVRVSFGSAKGEQFTLARVEEGHFDSGRWVFDRVWNGDQTGSGLNLTALPQVLKVKLATY